MTHRDTISTFLATASGPICDDCSSDPIGIVPRRTVDLNFHRMAKESATGAKPLGPAAMWPVVKRSGQPTEVTTTICAARL